MKTLLIYPPITDPTSGYHSLCYLETFARSRGFTQIDIIDTNIEALHHSMREEQAKQTIDFARGRCQYLERKGSLNAMEQIELYHAWKGAEFDHKKLPTAVEILQDHSMFYDYAKYRWAVEALSNWMDVISVKGFAGQFRGFNIPLRSYFNLFSVRDLRNQNITRKVLAPFESYFTEDFIPKVRNRGYSVFGLNVTYFVQLPFAIEISNLIRAAVPHAVILFGGTAVADVWKYLRDRSLMFDIFNSADVCVVGEGEQAFVAILDMVNKENTLHTIPNTIVNPKYKSNVNSRMDIMYENITSLPTPDYSKLPWDMYLSPHPYVYYSPTRGCYWNKCTFCDYGLNMNSPTSPWRQTPVEKIVEDLRVISKSHKFVYFSVDVLAPAMLLKLAERILEEKIDIIWGAEIRLEHYWSQDRCELLKKSGCTAVSVGFESGNQRILDLINKGTKVSQVGDTIRRFHQANIGVQMMGFTGFPSESYKDAMDSITFLKEYRKYWTFGGLGDFVLTKGAIVAQRPSNFGITGVAPIHGEDIEWELSFVDMTGGHGSKEQGDEIIKFKASLELAHFDRPWVGGTDTAHSMFYQDKYQSELMSIIHKEDKTILHELQSSTDCWYLNGKFIDDVPDYPIAELFKDRDLTGLNHQFTSEGRSLNSSQVQDILSSNIIEKHIDTVNSNQQFFLKNDGKVYVFSTRVEQVLKRFLGGATITDILMDAVGESRREVVKLIVYCVKNNYINKIEAFKDTNAYLPNPLSIPN